MTDINRSEEDRTWRLITVGELHLQNSEQEQNPTYRHGDTVHRQ
jgi:hypothetical protein